MEGEFAPEPLKHSVLDIHLDSHPRHDGLDSGPLEHSVTARAPRGGAVLFKNMTVLDRLEHSVPVGPQSWRDVVSPTVDTTVHLQSAIRTLGRPAGGCRGSIRNWRGYCCGCDWFSSTLVSHRMDA